MERAFRLKKDSDLYQKYFRAFEERKKFKELSTAFFDKNYPKFKGQYTMTSRLFVYDSKEILDKYWKGELCRTRDRSGLFQLKKKSKTQQLWESEVVSHINIDDYTATVFWWWDYISKGSYALWHHGDEVYGKLYSEAKFELTDDMVEIKLSEYYAVKEELEKELKQ